MPHPTPSPPCQPVMGSRGTPLMCEWVRMHEQGAPTCTSATCSSCNTWTGYDWQSGQYLPDERYVWSNSYYVGTIPTPSPSRSPTAPTRTPSRVPSGEARRRKLGCSLLHDLRLMTEIAFPPPPPFPLRSCVAGGPTRIPTRSPTGMDACHSSGSE
jgi:hypothetical protein